MQLSLLRKHLVKHRTYLKAVFLWPESQSQQLSTAAAIPESIKADKI